MRFGLSQVVNRGLWSSVPGGAAGAHLGYGAQFGVEPPFDGGFAAEAGVGVEPREPAGRAVGLAWRMILGRGHVVILRLGVGR